MMIKKALKRWEKHIQAVKTVVKKRDPHHHSGTDFVVEMVLVCCLCDYVTMCTLLLLTRFPRNKWEEEEEERKSVHPTLPFSGESRRVERERETIYRLVPQSDLSSFPPPVD